MKLTDKIHPIEAINEKIFRPDTPGIVRKIVWGTFIFFAFVGLCYSLKVLFVKPLAFFYVFGFFLLLGIITAGVILLFWNLMGKLSGTSVVNRMEQIYKDRGICKEMAESLKAGNAIESTNDKILRVFLMVQAECYRESAPIFADIDETALDARQLAMYLTARMRMFAMTGKQDKAEQILMERFDYLDDTYAEQPQLFPEYRPYADDALDYYMLAAAFAAIRKNTDKETEYRKKALFQVSMRDAFDNQIYPQIMELNSLYAGAKLQEAHVLENNLRGEIDRAMISVGRRTELNRLVGQARIYAAHTQLKEQKIYGDRVLPQ